MKLLFNVNIGLHVLDNTVNVQCMRPNSSFQTMGEWHEMHGRVGQPVCSLLWVYPP